MCTRTIHTPRNKSILKYQRSHIQYSKDKNKMKNWIFNVLFYYLPSTSYQLVQIIPLLTCNWTGISCLILPTPPNSKSTTTISSVTATRTHHLSPRINHSGMSPCGIIYIYFPSCPSFDSSVLAGLAVRTKHWLSTALALWRSSQCAGPVVILNAPGYTIKLHLYF